MQDTIMPVILYLCPISVHFIIPTSKSHPAVLKIHNCSQGWQLPLLEQADDRIVFGNRHHKQMTKDNLIAFVQSSLLQGQLLEHILLHFVNLLISQYPLTANPNKKSLYISTLKPLTIWVNACFTCRAVSSDQKLCVDMYFVVGRGALRLQWSRL